MSNLIIEYIQQDLLNNTEIELSTEDDLLGSGLLDSLSIMKLVQFVETTYQLKIPPEDLTIENFISVEAIENYLEQSKVN